MCLVPGLSDGRYLTSNEFLPEELATTSSCSCHHDHDGAGGTSRRRMLAGSLATLGGLAASSLLPSIALGQSPTSVKPGGDALVFLGTAGGPVVTTNRAQPCTALRVGGIYYMIDAGAETATQLAKAGIPQKLVRHVFITHNHSDHIAGYAGLAAVRWVTNSASRLDIWGPQQKGMHRGVRAMLAGDIASREFIAGTTKFDKSVRAHDVHVSRGDNKIHTVFEDANVKVSAVRVQHGTFAEMPYAYGYRFDIKKSGKSVTFSGDTKPNKNLQKLAKDTDILVHESISIPGLEALLTTVDPLVRSGLRKHILETHTNIDDVPRVAKESGAKSVALTHYGPFTPNSGYLAASKRVAGLISYPGQISAPKDLDWIKI